ncbi:NAD-dependent epimerase/dehydratase family protein [Aggregatimonas sangjinii]|uniref:NAD-dependent epimerase/dehydratase family protein n=1 Tax=Aggregatimonas sangjinii TaxID=2583587 RepID=A0A5B7STT2_9FLAO|nr:NAD-dependent epimerase/dehydratase family protein [Aggregatimonas sangjinii]QCX00418.1 NAD-dependent epimerase/dehydratase family protein [Aggregatimonas sangjinii]
MHTILGANGIIGEELAKVLKTDYTDKIRLVGRNPEKVNPSDNLFKADLFNIEEVNSALEDAEIAYLTVGLPYTSEVWLRDWIRIMENVIAACRKQRCKLIYFDNTYAYPQDVAVQKENTPMTSTGKKGIGKKRAAEALLTAMHNGEIEALICRAPEFYGPGITKSFTNALIFERLRNGKKPRIFLKDDVLRTLIYTPDASRAMALLANTPDAFGQTWHLPCDDNRLTYQQFIAEISTQLGRDISFDILSPFHLKIASLFNKMIKETKELFPRYTIDNIFDATKYKSRFPDFEVTSYPEGIREIISDYGIQ